MSDDFKNAVRPVTGHMVRCTYRLNGQSRAQAWYTVGTLVWLPDGQLHPCSSIKRCPLDAALDVVRQARMVFDRFNRTKRRAASRKRGAA